MKLLEIQKTLRNAGLKVFTTAEFQRATGMSASASRKCLLRYTHLDFFWQVKRGLYALREGDSAHLWVIAQKLYRPSYLSLETALSYYGFIPESVYAITSVTARITREFEACNMLFLYSSLKRSAYTGYAPLKIDGETIFVAEPEKALADYLYFVHLGKKKWNDRLAWKGLKKQRLWEYLKLFDRKNLLEWSQRVIAKKPETALS